MNTKNLWQWHPWFAWFPVKVWNGGEIQISHGCANVYESIQETVFLKTAFRKGHHCVRGYGGFNSKNLGGGYEMTWDYRSVEQHFRIEEALLGDHKAGGIEPVLRGFFHVPTYKLVNGKIQEVKNGHWVDFGRQA